MQLHIKLVLDPWVAEEINKVKDLDQALGNWIRLHLEKWAQENMKASLLPANSLHPLS